jgi:hypothetical protein
MELHNLYVYTFRHIIESDLAALACSRACTGRYSTNLLPEAVRSRPIVKSQAIRDLQHSRKNQLSATCLTTAPAWPASARFLTAQQPWPQPALDLPRATARKNGLFCEQHLRHRLDMYPASNKYPANSTTHMRSLEHVPKNLPASNSRRYYRLYSNYIHMMFWDVSALPLEILHQ